MSARRDDSAGGAGPLRGTRPLRVLRRLAGAGQALVQPGQRVEPETSVLSLVTFGGRVLREQVARQLRIHPADTEASMVVAPGEEVEPGRVIARSSLFWNHAVVRSGQEGTVMGASPSLGLVYLREQLPAQLAETVHLEVIRELSGDKNHFSDYLRVKEGQKVEKGQIIAAMRVDYGQRTVVSPVFGTVSNIAWLFGSLSIVPDRVSSVIRAHVPGIVTAVRGGREVEVTGYGLELAGSLGIGGEAEGLLSVGANAAEPWRPGSDGSLAGEVLVAGCVDLVSLREAAARGAVGVLAGWAHEKALCEFMGRELGAIVTGEEAVPAVIVLVEGCGQGALDPRLYDLLRRVEGLPVAINGMTHLRAGVIRPRILISCPPPPGEWWGEPRTVQDRPSATAPDDGERDLAIGARVRILRGRWAGGAGTVVGLPELAAEFPSGGTAAAAEIELYRADGRTARVIVARANLRSEGVSL